MSCGRAVFASALTTTCSSPPPTRSCWGTLPKHGVVSASVTWAPGSACWASCCWRGSRNCTSPTLISTVPPVRWRKKTPPSMVWRTALPCCGPTCGIGQLCQKPGVSTCAWPIRPISRPAQDGWRREAGARPGPKPPAPLTSCVLRQRICSAAVDGSAWSTGRNGRRS